MNTTPAPRARLLVFLCLLGLLLTVLAGCGGEDASQYETRESVQDAKVADGGSALSATALAGEEIFNANCSICHGLHAAGTSRGPTLIDRIYHPGHHSDASFRNAVANGVRQHHWVFGDMQPVAGVSAAEVEKIICYIREVQRADGIFEGNEFPTVC